MDGILFCTFYNSAFLNWGAEGEGEELCKSLYNGINQVV